MTTHPPSHGNGDRDYEDKDIRLRPILEFGVYITIATVATFFGIRWLFQHYETRRAADVTAAQPFSTERILPPEPRLLVNEPLTWKQQRAMEESLLAHYAWSNREAGIVRIPIDRAMERVLERGLPVKGAATIETTTAAPAAAATPEPAAGGEVMP